MVVTRSVLLVILLCFLVSWIPRVLPFIILKNKSLPPRFARLLKYLPISILFALTMSSLFDEKVGQWPQMHGLELLATIPTFLVAVKYKNLLVTVLVGVFCVALFRFLL